MKKFALLLTAAFSMTLILDSCSVQKRYHRKGFTVNWNHSSINKNKNRKVVHTESIQEDVIVSKTIEKQKLTRNYVTPVSMDISSTSVAVPTLTNTAPSIAAHTSVKNQAITSENTVKEISKEDAKSTKKAAKKIIKAIKNNKPADGQTIHWAALTGFITGLVGLFFLPIVLGLCAIIFSAIALSQIKRNPELYKGKGFAIAGLIIGIIDVVLVFLIIALLLAILL